MDPNSGRIYPSLTAALKAGVENPVELTGRREDVERISEAVQAVAAIRDAELARIKKAKKAAKIARRANR